MLRKIAYCVVDAGNCFNAYAPQYPGCLATGKTVDDARRNFMEALQFHIEGMLEDGDELPRDEADAGMLVVNVPEKVKVDGGALREFRKKMDMTQAELAERLEVTKATISEWENGHRELPGTVKFALEAVYSVAAK